MYSLQKIGTDTEVFLKNLGGKYIASCGLIGGTKEKPRPIDNEGGAVQEDNVMLEFNTKPAVNAEEWVANINHVLMHIVQELKEKNLVMDIVPSVEFGNDQLMSKQAQTMGCDPDFDAWSFQSNDPLSPMIMKNVRTAGGHVHVSFKYKGECPNRLQMTNVIRAMDLTLGIPSIILDDDNRRRKFYGKMGAHRIKSEDRVEYRALSNFWIKNDKLKAWVFNNTVDAIRRLNNLGDFSGVTLWGKFLEDDIRKCIQNSDKDAANRLIKLHRIEMP